MRVVRVTGLRRGKLYVFERRLHHGAAGAVVFTTGAVLYRRIVLTHPVIALIPLVVGTLAMKHDWPDFPWLFDRDALQFSHPRPVLE